MKIKVGVAVLGAMVMANVALASPLTDYSTGKTALDVSFESPKITDDNDTYGSTGSVNGKSIVGFGITTGLGNKFALQYKQSSPRTKDVTTDVLNLGGGITSINSHETVDVNEYNLLYQINTNISVLAGVSQVKGKLQGDLSDNTNTRGLFQVGFVGSAPVADKTTAYTTAAFGNDLTTWKLGLSYQVDKNWEMDVYYGYNKYRNLQWQTDSSQSDFTIKGVGYGISYKF
ncbi:MAG TPA: outer membrane beta-barrel protein [Methylomusa anaerophila]|uniref:Outer membrane protein beta-barrel domain-containing protein n=1 Tax=Methylomusa anaerophila TaxID=1930071 RepID=A0A348ALX9_9FIRM|nr:outer membrane beta-barrel protein [Methylomusa anaerophila]BBB92077.1 hypothetical protein MAMMFC1_02762 [Methylomusa anaerophila]HML87910.1 outer membrane beta-barrel protein [Methylomusa anaerophila]